MEIRLIEVAKRFRFDWIFRNVSLSFNSEHRYAILGPNGSGKSTLMKVISGHLSASKGRISFEKEGISIDIDALYKKIAYAAPYIELIEEFTLTEAIAFHARFKPFIQGLYTEKIISILGFEKSYDKEVRYFSSGMKQRLKLVLAICADTPILLLDEPTTNLDAQGAAWYKDLLMTYGKNRIVIIATNVEEDYSFFCDKVIKIADFQKK
jgi:ABC-type multidrug transport system ATPase subunit